MMLMQLLLRAPPTTSKMLRSSGCLSQSPSCNKIQSAFRRLKGNTENEQRDRLPESDAAALQGSSVAASVAPVAAAAPAEAAAAHAGAACYLHLLCNYVISWSYQVYFAPAT